MFIRCVRCDNDLYVLKIFEAVEKMLKHIKNEVYIPYINAKWGKRSNQWIWDDLVPDSSDKPKNRIIVEIC